MTMSEKELRLLWHHQLLDQMRLSTTDGRRVVVFSPGSENHDGGPDFREARIRIGNTTYVGDVEVHLRPGQWFAHRHHIDPHYNNVVLHVVLSDDRIVTRTSGGRGIPVVPIGGCLSGTPPPSPCPEVRPQVPAGIIRMTARSLGIERLERKTRTAEERLLEIAVATGMSVSGEAMDQLLYEGLMEGMGYAKNRVPFLFLARSVSLEALRRFGLEDRETVAAILFGAAGLLPRSVADTESQSVCPVSPPAMGAAPPRASSTAAAPGRLALLPAQARQLPSSPARSRCGSAPCALRPANSPWDPVPRRR